LPPSKESIFGYFCNGPPMGEDLWQAQLNPRWRMRACAGTAGLVDGTF